MDTAAIGSLVPVLIPIIAPMITALLKKLVPQIPKLFLPLSAVGAGTLVDVLNSFATGMGQGEWWGPVLGLLGVGVREVYDQLMKVAGLRKAVALLLLPSVFPVLAGCATFSSDYQKLRSSQEFQDACTVMRLVRKCGLQCVAQDPAAQSLLEKPKVMAIYSDLDATMGLALSQCPLPPPTASTG